MSQGITQGKKASSFDFIHDVSQRKTDLSRSGHPLTNYSPWLTNKHFGMYVDTILYANEVNSMSSLDKQLQHDYYLYSVPARNRRSPWNKPDQKDAVEAIRKWYGINTTRAREVLRILPKADTDEIIRRIENDGRSGGGGAE